MDNIDDLDQSSRLSLEQLAYVLQHVPLEDRLPSCALVHSSWQAAAALATTEISCSYESIGLSKMLKTLCSKAQLTSMSIYKYWLPSGNELLNPPAPLKLPMAQLQHLQMLELSCVPWEPAQLTAGQPSSTLQPVSLASLTALTSLSLSGSSVRLAGLEALAGLKALSIDSKDEDESEQDDQDEPEASAQCPSTFWEAASAVLVAVLPKLQDLTHLKLYMHIGNRQVIARVSTLHHLEQLDLTLGPATTLPTMPQSLTSVTVWLNDDQADSELESDDSVILQRFGNMCQLTGLHRLELHDVSALDSAVLAGMSKLRSVDFQGFYLTSTSTQPLMVFSNMTALQQLCLLYHDEMTLTPAEAAALTTSSHLTHLSLCSLNDSLQEMHYEAMFPPGRQLQQLQKLQVGTALVSSPNTALVDRLITCCPGLNELVLGRPSWADVESTDLMPLDTGVGQQLAAGLRALTCLTQLARLEVNTPAYKVPAAVWHALATLTGLEELTVECAAPCAQHVLLLTSCQRLELLDITGEAECFRLMVMCEAPEGSPADVWRQLPQKLAELECKRVEEAWWY